MKALTEYRYVLLRATIILVYGSVLCGLVVAGLVALAGQGHGYSLGAIARDSLIGFVGGTVGFNALVVTSTWSLRVIFKRELTVN